MNLMSTDSLARSLAAIVGPDHVLTEPDLLASYETDWTRRFSGRARLVVRPASTEEASAVMKACAAAEVSVIPQGGNTGLVGGSVPRGGEVVISLLRLDRLEPVDTVAGQVTAEAGVTIARLQDHVRDAGWLYPVDLASRDSATVGGTIATNAGGIRVLRYGPTRAQVAGIECVLPNGEIISRMSGLTKDNTGYDLAGLFTGSEGTLGIVTKARLKLSPPMPARTAALLALRDTAAGLSLLQRLREALPSLEAIEAFYEEGLRLVCGHTGLPRPFAGGHGCYLLVECAAREDPGMDLAAALAVAPEVVDSVMGIERPQRDRIWRYREAHTESISAAGVPHKLDVTLPLGRMAAFEAEVRQCVADAVPGARAILFGHLGDGNLHVNVLGPAAEDERADDAVLRLAASYGGSISAEHGIGVAKAPWLHLTRSEADIAAMRAIKHALDPGGMMNPGVIFGRGR